MVMLCICQLMPNELFTIELKNLSIARRCGRNNTVSARSADEQQLRLCVSEGQLRFLKLPRMISRAGNRCQTGGWCDCTYPREQLWMRQGDEQRLTPAHGKAGNSGLLAPRRGGKILLDGQDIRTLSRDEVRRNFGMVLQDTWIKRGTVRENICFGKPDATEEEMVRAAKEARSYDFIRRLPNGFDTVLNEDSISGGQKQLLCITRVMLALPPMLILDEATSSIDTRTEMQIQEAFDKLMEGRTSFVVAHRLSTIRAASVILVMRDGKIIEKGTHEELLAKGGFYHKLYNSQFDNSGKAQ